jgi:thiamine kinase
LVTLPGEKSISTKTQQLLQKTLLNWQQWQTTSKLDYQPEVVRELVGGRTNKTFLVAAGDFQAVVRINSLVSSKLGIDRQREARILGLLQSTGLVPKVYFIDAEVLVSEFIEGDCLNSKSLKNTHIMESLSAALRLVQSVKMPDGIPRNYLEYCQNYFAHLNGDIVSLSVKEQIEAAALEVDTEEWEPVICHHDMVPENIILNERGLFIIDWEYAALGHPRLDFIRLYDGDYGLTGQQEGAMRSLFKVKQAMDKLWLAVQL